MLCSVEVPHHLHKEFHWKNVVEEVLESEAQKADLEDKMHIAQVIRPS